MTKTKSKRPRICLIYTGGTIGMVRRKTAVGEVLKPAQLKAGPNASLKKQFLQLLGAEKEATDIARIDFVLLMQEDSTNIVPSDWTKMADAVRDRLHKGYDGFVIAHGTDTMHFSASALAFAFGDRLKVPIVFTGAQASPDIPHGDARVNLLRAIKVASLPFSEVVIAFGDFVLRGCRAQKKHEKRFDAFEAPATFPLGYITADIQLGPDVKKPWTWTRTPAAKRFLRKAYNPHFAGDDDIVQISLIPGLRPQVLNSLLDAPNCRGILLQSFGEGNVPNKGEYSFVNFIKTATEKGKTVVIVSQFPANATEALNYEPGVIAVAAGAIPTGNMTNAAAAVKFRWVMQVIDDRYGKNLPPARRRALIKAMMNANFVEEITNIPKR